MIIALAMIAFAAGDNSNDLCGAHFSSAAEAIQATSANPALEKLQEQDNVLSYLENVDTISRKGSIFWIFAGQGHPAHPAILCSAVLLEADPTSTNGFAPRRAFGSICEADKTACEDFIDHSRPMELTAIMKPNEQ